MQIIRDLYCDISDRGVEAAVVSADTVGLLPTVSDILEELSVCTSFKDVQMICCVLRSLLAGQDDSIKNRWLYNHLLVDAISVLREGDPVKAKKLAGSCPSELVDEVSVWANVCKLGDKVCTG
jgi:hypothetical protein